MGRQHRFRAELLHAVDARELAALFLDERSRARAAGLVHRAIHHPAVRQPDVFRVLPANLENRVHPRIEMPRALRVRRDFVEHKHRVAAVARRHQRPGDFPAAAGDAEGPQHAVSRVLGHKLAE